MEELTTLLEKSRSELEARVLFAEKFPLEENYASALATFSSFLLCTSRSDILLRAMYEAR